MNEAISQQDANEIHARFHPHDRIPNQTVNTPAEHLPQPLPGNDDAVSARNTAVPRTVETPTTGAEHHIRRHRCRRRRRNCNFAAANSKTPLRRNIHNRMENHTQSTTRAHKDHSRHCHLCNKKTSSEVPHARLCTRPGCRKAVCLRCSREVNWPGKIVDAAHFECPHCLNVCGEITNRNVQCFSYNAATERRRLQNRQRRGGAEGRLPQVQPLRVYNANDHITPPRLSRQSGDLLREKEAVPNLSAGQGPGSAPIRADRTIRRNRSRGRGRNSNFAAANRQSPPHRNSVIRMENHRQSGTGPRKKHSRFCHLCNKKTSSDEPHARLCTGPRCRKAVCLKCIREVHWPGKTLDEAYFECSHCLEVCRQITNRNVQCFTYNAETERRRQENEQRRVQPVRVDNAGNRITPRRPSRRSGDLLRENEAVPPLAAAQGPDSAPIQNVNPRGAVLARHVARQLAYPYLNLLPPQVPHAEVIASSTLLHSQSGIEQVIMEISTADDDTGEPIFDA